MIKRRIREPGPRRTIACLERIKRRAKQSLPGNIHGYPGGVARDPASAPHFGRNGRGARPASRIKHKIATIGRHEKATSDNLGGGLNNVVVLWNVGSLLCVIPDVRTSAVREV